MIARDFIMIADYSALSKEAAVTMAVDEVRRMCADMKCFRVDRVDHLGPDSLHVYVSGALAEGTPI